MIHGSIRNGLFVLALFLLLGLTPPQGGATPGGSDQAVPIAMEPLPVLQRAQDVGPADPGETLVIAVSLPIAQPEAMQAFVDRVSNPSSPDYRQFISPEDVGARFGVRCRRCSRWPTTSRSTASPSPRSRGTASRSWRAARSRRPSRPSTRRCAAYTAAPQQANEPAEFIAPATAGAAAGRAGGARHRRQRPRHLHAPAALKQKLTPFLSRGLYDAQPIFDDGMTGAGRTVGISNFDGFRAATGRSTSASSRCRRRPAGAALEHRASSPAPAAARAPARGRRGRPRHPDGARRGAAGQHPHLRQPDGRQPHRRADRGSQRQRSATPSPRATAGSCRPPPRTPRTTCTSR